MSLERRIAEINPAAAQVGIYNEKLLPSPKSRNRQEVAAVTGKLEVCCFNRIFCFYLFIMFDANLQLIISTF